MEYEDCRCVLELSLRKLSPRSWRALQQHSDLALTQPD